jgi:hypothetical protein
MLGYLRQHPNGRFRDDARAAFGSFRAPVPGATYVGTTATGSQVKLSVDADGIAVTGVQFGQAAADPGATAPTIASTSCYTINSLTLTGHAPIGDDDRGFTLSQRGAMNLISGSGAVGVEAIASGAFSDGQASGTVQLTFVDQPSCNSAPIAWTARIP